MRQSRRSRSGDLIRAVGPNDRRRFLVGLRTARGWETTVKESVVVARRGDRIERLAIASRSRLRPSPTAPAEAIAVVALGDPERIRRVAPDDAWVLSVDKFYGLARYGLPAGRGDDLVTDRFGVRLDDLPVDDRGVGARGTNETGGAVVSPPPRRPSSLPAAPLVSVALLLAAVVVTAGPGDVPVLGGALSGHGSSTLTPVATTLEPTLTSEPRAVALGVITAGAENATCPAAAHRRTAVNRSHRWMFGYRELAAGDKTGREVEVVRVEAPYVYVSEVRCTGRLRAFPRSIASEDSCADGIMRYARRPAEPDGVAACVLDPDARGGPGRRAFRATRYLDWYLSTDKTSVTRVESMTNETAESGTVLYRARGFGTDSPRSRDYRIEAVVEESGFVRSTRIAYETRDSLGIRVWFAYDTVGGTTVTRPTQLDRADGSTGGRTVVPTSASGQRPGACHRPRLS